jgi:hypothetical protein
MVQITPGGRNVMHGAQPMWEEAQKYITERLGADTWDGVMEDLHRLSMIVEDASVDEAG